MATSSESWIDGLQYSSLFWPSPREPQQRKGQIRAYVEYFGQFASEQFQDDIAELIKSRYPSKEERLLDDVLATFVLHHPEFGEAVIHPIISCIIDGILVYDRNDPPFASFVSMFSPSSESEYSHQWALACMEILRILTLYNRPYKIERSNCEVEKSRKSSDGSTCESVPNPSARPERKSTRPLSPWITDILLAAPLGIRSDYFRWCGGVVGRYSAGELKPPITITSRGSGKHPQLMPSTPRWAVANGAGVILSVCDEEVARYDTVTLTAAAVPALLLPPPSIHDQQVAGLPALEPYARLFHRYYAIATPSATQRLLLGLLEAPPSWAPDALDAAVQLVELLRAAEEYASGVRLPRNWMHFHFLRAIGIAMSMRAGVAADAAAALLFRILSQPALLFPPLRQVEGVDVQHEPMGGYINSYSKQIEVPLAEATIEATAQGIASMLCAHGPEVEWRICTIWEAAYGLIPLSSSAVDLPEIIVATPLQPPILSWNLYIPLLKVLEYLPRGSPSEACLMKIFVATVEAILQRTHPLNGSYHERTVKSRYMSGMGPVSKNLSEAELRTMVHSLFLESCASVELSSRLLFVVLTVCISHEAQINGSTRPIGDDNGLVEELPEEDPQSSSDRRENRRRKTRSRKVTKQGPVGAFNSFVLGAVCALSHELKLFTWISRGTNRKNMGNLVKPAKTSGSSDQLQSSFDSAINHTHRILAILEALFSLKPSSIGTSWGYSSNEIVAAAMVAAHVSELFRQSKACMSSLSGLMQCKLDTEIQTRASSLYNLIDIHSKAVASIVNNVEPLQAHLMQAPVCREAFFCLDQKQNGSSGGCSEVGESSLLKASADPKNLVESGRPLISSEGQPSSSHEKANGNISGKGIADFPVDASDLANFLTMDRHLGFDFSAKVLLRSVLAEKQELCFSVVSLLWHKLVTAPEIQPIAESTSAQQGWRQVVDALCNVVSESPTNAATAVVLQAEKELQPWIAKDDDQGQKMWRTNQRIIRLIVELMRIHERPESLVILASASDLLLRATDGLLVDGEACTLPQLELLEVTARAVQLVLDWGESGVAVADGLSNLLKCRISATVRCLSHPSAHVRALSTSVLRDILNTGIINSRQKLPRTRDNNGAHGSTSSSSSSPYQLFELEDQVINWKVDIEKCLTWEAHSRLSSGMSLQFLNTAAKQLGCAISL